MALQTTVDTIGFRVRIERLRRGLIQWELAQIARVTAADISLLERDRPIPARRRAAILAVLELTDADPTAN